MMVGNMSWQGSCVASSNGLSCSASVCHRPTTFSHVRCPTVRRQQTDSGDAPARSVLAEASAVSTSYSLPSQSRRVFDATSEQLDLHAAKRAKLALMTAVASLDRGLAANARQAEEVDDMATTLEGLGSLVRLGSNPAAIEQLAGKWRLMYTSGFNSGSLGGRRPGPPAFLLPGSLGQIYQNIDPQTARLDNIVEVQFFVPAPLLALSPHEAPALRLTLGHDYTVEGDATVRIVYEATSAQLVGSTMLGTLPQLALPSLPDFLKPPRGLRSATFEVTYLDGSLRITRGDRGELRIYVKDGEDGMSL